MGHIFRVYKVYRIFDEFESSAHRKNGENLQHLTEQSGKRIFGHRTGASSKGKTREGHLIITEKINRIFNSNSGQNSLHYVH